MKEQTIKVDQIKQKVLNKISENDGEIIYTDSSLIKAIFPENKIERAISTHFEISERLNQKSELYGGIRLTVFLGFLEREQDRYFV
jgi:hypothetical protein